jgi:hypothetical protein
MRIELKHKPLRTLITITTEHDDPDKSITPKFTSEDKKNIPYLQHDLNRCYGHYGHGIELESTTNLDLRAAVHQLKDYEIIKMEPEVMRPNPIPPGVCT